jgi:hypothetical protein
LCNVTPVCVKHRLQKLAESRCFGEVKLPGHPVRMGQARGGRSTEFPALSMSNGLPGIEISFILYPLTPPIPIGRDGARYGQALG